jgi:hypothetical protein
MYLTGAHSMRFAGMTGAFRGQAMSISALDDIAEVISKARAVAMEYYRLTGKPLGITGEIGEYEAALTEQQIPDWEKCHAALDGLGQQGWELVALHSRTGEWPVAVLKRRVKDSN